MRKIIHVDMDAFYVSVEIRDNPALAGKPVAVGGKRTSRGVLSTCNYVAREYGVRSAMPTSVALRKCPQLILLPGRMEVYRAVSQQIREIFSRYTQLIEPLSLDEAYLDVTACEAHQGSATLIAQAICRTIHQELDLTASAGVAPVKFLAKIASDMNKPNGVFVITPEQVDSFIDTMPLNKIPGVGKVSFEKLNKQNLFTGSDIKQSDPRQLHENFGKLGSMLWQRCQGEDNRPVETSRVRKSVGVERTFPEDIDEIDHLIDILVSKLIPELKTRSAKHVLQRGIHKIGIKVKFSDFQQTTKELSFSSFDDHLFVQLLKEALQRGSGKKVRLLGVHIGLNELKSLQTQYEFHW